MAKKRTDAERRARQCERLSRLLRVLRLILGPGRWDAESIARELRARRVNLHFVNRRIVGVRLGRGVEHNRVAKLALNVYNREHVMTNLEDDPEGLRRALSRAFARVDIELRGSFALFTARP